MWWLYHKTGEDETTVTYSYSRESYGLTGQIQFNKKTKEITAFTPSEEDADSKFSEKVAKDKFWGHVVEKGFPDRERIICG